MLFQIIIWYPDGTGCYKRRYTRVLCIMSFPMWLTFILFKKPDVIDRFVLNPIILRGIVISTNYC